MQTKRKILLAIAAFHLILVACGAARVRWWKLGPIGIWIQQYGVYTGSSTTYSFFAPNVGSTRQAKFELYDGKGSFLGTDSFEIMPTREANLRAINITESMANEIEDEKNRRLLSMSWAGKMFARHPEADVIVLKVENYYLPPMRQYHKGMPGEWEPYYQAKFARKKELKNG